MDGIEEGYTIFHPYDSLNPDLNYIHSYSSANSALSMMITSVSTDRNSTISAPFLAISRMWRNTLVPVPSWEHGDKWWDHGVTVSSKSHNLLYKHACANLFERKRKSSVYFHQFVERLAIYLEAESFAILFFHIHVCAKHYINPVKLAILRIHSRSKHLIGIVPELPGFKKLLLLLIG